MFELKSTTAHYCGEINATDIAVAIQQARSAARDREITAFVATVPNEEFSTIERVTRIIGVKPIIESADDGVTIRYMFVKTINVEISGARSLAQTPPDTICLAHRIVTAPTKNGIESI